MIFRYGVGYPPILLRKKSAENSYFWPKNANFSPFRPSSFPKYSWIVKLKTKVSFFRMPGCLWPGCLWGCPDFWGQEMKTRSLLEDHCGQQGAMRTRTSGLWGARGLRSRGSFLQSGRIYLTPIYVKVLSCRGKRREVKLTWRWTIDKLG